MSAPYGELVVVLGDAFVGQRASDVPEKFKKMLAPDKMQHLVSTGNLCASETYEFFRSVAPRLHAVRGDMDDYSSSMTNAEELVFEVGEFRIGVCHGHQIVPWGDRDALALVARRLDVDILVTGHTHVCEAFEVEGTWFVNPGSITGAYTPLREEVKPSFVLLSIQANTVKLYMYELNPVSGEVDIHRAKFTKPSKNPFAGSSLPPIQPPSAAPASSPAASTPAPSPTATTTTTATTRPLSIKQPVPVANAPASTPSSQSFSAAKKGPSPTAPAIPKRPQQNSVATPPPASDPVDSSTALPEPVSPPAQKRRVPPAKPDTDLNMHPPERPHVSEAPVMDNRPPSDIGRQIDQELNLANSVFGNPVLAPPTDFSADVPEPDVSVPSSNHEPDNSPQPDIEAAASVSDVPIDDNGGETSMPAEEHWDDV